MILRISCLSTYFIESVITTNYYKYLLVNWVKKYRFYDYSVNVIINGWSTSDRRLPAQLCWISRQMTVKHPLAWFDGQQWITVLSFRHEVCLEPKSSLRPKWWKQIKHLWLNFGAMLNWVNINERNKGYGWEGRKR